MVAAEVLEEEKKRKAIEDLTDADVADEQAPAAPAPGKKKKRGPLVAS